MLDALGARKRGKAPPIYGAVSGGGSGSWPVSFSQAAPRWWVIRVEMQVDPYPASMPGQYLREGTERHNNTQYVRRGPGDLALIMVLAGIYV